MKDTEHRKMHMQDYHSSEFWKESNEQRVKKMANTKSSSSSKAETSARMKDFWSVNREKMHTALCARPAVYRDIYGLTKKQIANKLGKTCWAVEQLHKRGELKCLL